MPNLTRRQPATTRADLGLFFAERASTWLWAIDRPNIAG